MKNNYEHRTKKFRSLEEMQRFLKHRNFLKIGGYRKWILKEFNIKEYFVEYFERVEK